MILIAAFAVSKFAGGDDDDAQASENTSTTVPVAEEPKCDNPTVAAAVGREAPDVEPPAEDTDPNAVEPTTLVEGTGDGAVAGDTVVVHYVGKTSDGKTFDCSWKEDGTGDPFPVTLGGGSVIPGWDEGLIGVKAGERRHLLIGSEKAYGSQGAGGVIPPDAPLAFDVDVLEVQKAGSTPSTTVADPTASSTPSSTP